MFFDNLDLDPKVLQSISEAGYTEPTEIQKEAIPKILSGHNIRASAQTGTGKTAAFLLPAMNRLAKTEQRKGKGPTVLVLAPTRELAMQIAAQSEVYSKHLNRVKTVCVSGGVPYHKQLNKLSRPYEILIATPGRLIDYLNRKKIDLSSVEMVVLDEADRMLDMGFIQPVKQVVNATPKGRQVLLFSATLEKKIIKLSEELMDNPIQIEIHAKHARHENIQQRLHYVDDLNHKNKLLEHILNTDEVENTIIFTSTKRHADHLVSELKDKGHLSAALHGDMNQRQRTRTIAQLKAGKITTLVATDVAARGIDVQSITHVINFDLPYHIEDYVHRIGRTGRAGSKGTALSFAGGRDSSLIRQIEKFTGQAINVVEVPGLEPRKKPKQHSSESNGPRKRSNGPSRKPNGPRKGNGGKRPFNAKSSFQKKRGPQKRGRG